MKHEDNRAQRLPRDRLVAVFEAIQAGQYPNATTLAVDLEVSSRSVKRDIDQLRLHHGIDIAYDRARHGYYLVDPGQGFRGAQFTEAEVLALFVARQALLAYRGTSLEPILSDGFRRLEKRFDSRQRFTVGDLSQLITLQIPAPEELQAEYFQTLTQALRESREVTFAYRGLADVEPKNRRVRPYHLGNVENRWYLFGWDTMRKAVRTFALTRMSRLELTHRRFEAPHEFDLIELLRGSFGVHAGEEGREVTVEIQFDAWAARLVRERRWHASQTLRDSGDGVILSVKLSGLDEIERWILSWGSHARVLAPDELRDRIHQAAAAIVLSFQ